MMVFLPISLTSELITKNLPTLLSIAYAIITVLGFGTYLPSFRIRDFDLNLTPPHFEVVELRSSFFSKFVGCSVVVLKWNPI